MPEIPHNGIAVSLDRVLQQRSALAELGAYTLRANTLDDLLHEATRLVAKGSGVGFGKILEWHRGEGDLLMRAGWGWKPGFVGHSRAKDDESNSAGQCIRSLKPVLVPDLRNCKYDLPPLFGEHGIIASCNIPIVSADGPYGVLEIDSRTAREFDGLDISFLEAVGLIVAEGVSRVRRTQELQSAFEARETQYHTQAVLFREQQHRVRNNLQSIHSLLRIASGRVTNPGVREAFQAVERRVIALATLYDHLLGAGMSDRADLGEYIDSLTTSICNFEKIEDRGIGLRSEADPVSVDLDICTAIGTVVNELIGNSIEHAFGDRGGNILVRLKHAGDHSVLTVEDNGQGFTGDEARGLGLRLVRSLVKQVGAHIERRSSASGGVIWKITLPFAQPATA